MVVSASTAAQLALCESSAYLHQRQITEKKDKYKECLQEKLGTMCCNNG